MRAKFFFEFDFSQRSQGKEVCELCGKPFRLHSQQLDADPVYRHTYWCPNPMGTGFSSRCFRRKKETVKV